jgi:hypothetical protein
LKDSVGSAAAKVVSHAQMLQSQRAFSAIVSLLLLIQSLARIIRGILVQ